MCTVLRVSFLGWEHWSSDYDRTLMSKVLSSNPSAGEWMDHFSIYLL